ncbi:MAG: transposase domain-containing protein [Clostridia bacterium]
MPRVGWRKASGPRLADHIALAVLTDTVPPAGVDAVVSEMGRQEHRQRWLPARVLV